MSRDGATLLSLYVVLLMGIPSRYVVGPLGGAGAPAGLLAMAGLLWWVAHRLTRSRRQSGRPQPARSWMVLFCCCVIASYIAATVRPIEPDELRQADLGILIVCGWLGLVQLGTDGIPSRARLDSVLRRLTVAGGMVAVLGLIQFKTGQAYTNYLRLPGLSENNSLSGIANRDGFARPSGTAVHPIEFGVALTMILPIALHYAMADTHRGKARRWFPVAAIALCIPVSVSRSTVLCTVLVLAFLLPTWSKPVRRRAYAMMAVLMGLVYFLVPGMLGTLAGLFTGVSSDSSAQSRTGSYAIAFEFIRKAPVFGRGFSTFLPAYRILDNQYLGSFIELGAVGLSCLIALFVTGILTAGRVRIHSTDPATRALAQALAATTAAGASSYALFDAFSFPMIPGLLFLTLGAIGALHRLHGAAAAPPDSEQPSRPLPLAAAPSTSAGAVQDSVRTALPARVPPFPREQPVRALGSATTPAPSTHHGRPVTAAVLTAAPPRQDTAPLPGGGPWPRSAATGTAVAWRPAPGVHRTPWRRRAAFTFSGFHRYLRSAVRHARVP